MAGITNVQDWVVYVPAHIINHQVQYSGMVLSTLEYLYDSLYGITSLGLPH